MAVLRGPNIDDSIQNYIATIGFFCVISCTVLMLRFLGFKASLDILNTNKTSSEHDNVPTISVNGAYRVNRGEFFDSGSLQDPPRKVLPAVKPPSASKPASTERQSKSTSDLRQVQNPPSNLHKSTPDISQDPRGTEGNKESADPRKLNKKDAQKQQNEQLKLNKKRLEEQKKRDKLAAQEQAKQEKLRKEREKVQAQQRAKEAKKIEKQNQAKGKNKDKGKVDTPKPLAQGSQAQGPRAQPLAQGPRAPPQAQGPRAPPQAQDLSHAPRPQYSTNTLESSISKTSGPPPYSAQDRTAKAEPAVVRNESDNTGNTSFAKREDAGGSSWDMIAQHREQINRKNFASADRPKQMVLDLQFNADGPSGSSTDDKGNSDV
ncbi:actin cytoskeleton-regulatory complex protein PAN1-like [Hyposmocoma kahamanoa]|uniref:actin cytoskeleton-regulatory complex protein PAN1-like n=1 Tax=Hyposmocoma kahamanoa TaxID=1477025 RepID=UPI000E6D5E84|nr:actin cytoskeleton-regulatory complex protein PAN1-like [Hyposmocoma kahamanoa]